MDRRSRTGSPAQDVLMTCRRMAVALAMTLALGLSTAAQEPAGNPAARPEPRDGAWRALHEEFLKRAKEGPIDLLFLGDTITAGWANRGPRGPGSVWDRFYRPRRAASFAIAGDRTQHLLWRLENGEVEGIAPKVVVLLIGTSNVHANTPDEIAEGVAAVVTLLRSKLPAAKVLLLGVFPRGEKGDPIRERVRSLNTRVARLDDGRNVRFLDLGGRFLESDGTLSRDVMPDQLHLSRKGYRIWADAMEPTLWSLLEGT